MRIGLYGGSFNPIHNGHVKLANHVRKKCGLDEIWFIPALYAPLKDHQPVPFEMRVEMIEMAIGPYRKLKCCLIEKDMPIPSYTINTVLKLKELYPEHSFCFIIGEDQYLQLESWKDSERLVQEVQFIVVNRGVDVEEREGFIYVEDFDDDSSSTKVRQGEFSHACKAVRKYIVDNGLYMDEIASAHMSNHRYVHSCSVAEVMKTLAKAHGLDETKAYVIGMLHDIAKQMDKDAGRRLMEVYYPEQLEIAPAIWHQYQAMVLLKTKLGIHDKDILEAVGHHVIGDSRNPYAQAVFIADKIEPTRGYDNTAHMALARKDLAAAVEMVQQEQKEYILKTEGISV